MKIKNAKFVTSIASTDIVNESGIPEIAVAGKSNVGKSSFINFIVNAKLARSSKEPGRTRLLNYFSVNNDEFYFVDLPGYGYANVSDKEKNKWRELIEYYFTNSTLLKNVFVLIDVRRVPTFEDIQLVSFLQYYSIPYTIICTKADKATKNEISKSKSVIANAFKIGIDSLIVTSADKKLGLDFILSRIEQILYPNVDEGLIICEE